MPTNDVRETLDRHLNTRILVPDFDTFTDRFDTRSTETRERLDGVLDVPYGPTARQAMDVFAPAANTVAPINVFFHGGYWRAGSKERYSYIADTFVANGAACVVVEYDLTPAVTMDELVAQCRAAIAFVHRNATSWGADPDRIYVSGHSAGAHIVGMLMAAGWHNAHSVPTDVVKGGCGISGLYDLDAIRLSYLNEDVRLDEDTAATNSPARLTPASAAPLIAVVGALEGPEFLRQNKAIATAWGDRTTVTAITLPNIHHYMAVEQLGDLNSPLSRSVLNQMELA